MFEKIVFSENKQSDFMGFSQDKAKKHLERCFLINGAASKKVRTLRTAHPSGQLILRRHLAPIKSGATIPNLRCPP